MSHTVPCATQPRPSDAVSDARHSDPRCARRSSEPATALRSPSAAEVGRGGAVGVVDEGALESAGWSGVVRDHGVSVAVGCGPVGAVGAAAELVHSHVFGAVVASTEA